MAQASTALQFARGYLNDPNGIQWTDAILFPLLQIAFAEMVLELNRNNLGITKQRSSPITVAAGTLSLTIANLVNPIALYEGDVGSDIEDYEDMIKVTFLPLLDQTEWLTYWTWQQQLIQFIGSTSNRSVIVDYEGGLTVPQLQTDTLTVLNAEMFLGPKIAALACDSIGKSSNTFEGAAQSAMYKIVQMIVTDDQRPTRRKAYRSAKGLYGPSR